MMGDKMYLQLQKKASCWVYGSKKFRGGIPKLNFPSLKLTAKAPANGQSQKEIHLPTIDFQGQAVSFREVNNFVNEVILQP